MNTRTVAATVLLVPLLALSGCGHPDDPVALLVAAADHGDAAVVQRAIDGGVAVDSVSPGDGTALIAAARRGDTALIALLLKAGADPDIAARGDGNPLIAAAAAGQHAAAAQLLQAHADVDAIVPDDETPLINAARAGHLDIVQLLVAHGADVNLGVVADRGQWRSPLNQARDAAIRDYLASKGAVVGHR